MTTWTDPLFIFMSNSPNPHPNFDLGNEGYTEAQIAYPLPRVIVPLYPLPPRPTQSQAHSKQGLRAEQQTDR